jgi:hypothetical protein
VAQAEQTRFRNSAGPHAPQHGMSVKIGLATDAACRVVNSAATMGSGISARGSVGARLCGRHARMSKHGAVRQRVKLEKRGSCWTKARHHY